MLTAHKLFLGLAFAGAAVTGSATDYYVAPGGTGDYSQANPGPSPVEAALRATASGDVVHLAPGTYETAADIEIQAGVKIVGAGPEVTHVRRVRNTGNDRGVVVRGDGAEIRDLTISNGYTDYQGAGIIVVDAVKDFLASNCVIENCSARYQGGGVYRGTLRDCVVRNCSVFGSAEDYGSISYYPPSQLERTGGGVFGGTYYDCTIVSNSAVFGGGGIGGAGGHPDYYGYDRVARAYNCTIAYNTATYGAGVFAGRVGSAYLTDCLVVSNRAVSSTSCQGGGAHLGILSNCVVKANESYAYGAGMIGGRAFDCEIVGNRLVGEYTDDSSGGAGASGSVLVRCSIRDNLGLNVPYGVGCRNCYATNCIVTGNGGQYGGGGMGGVFSGCVISNNVAFYSGAACYNSRTYNCVVTGNVTSGFYGVLTRGYHEGDLIYGNTSQTVGILCCESGGTDLAAVNCTIADNSCANGDTVGFTMGYMTNCVVAGHSCDVRNVQAAVNSLFVSYDSEDPSIQNAVNCKIGVDPKFMLRVPEGEWPYQLRLSSPAVNAGLLFDWMLGAKDLCGRPRVRQGVPDMGALECNAKLGLMLTVY